MTDTAIAYDVFISYSRQDATQVELLTSRLANEAGLRVWFDRARLQPGFAWRDEIERDMQQCAATLIVWGPHGGLGPVQREERGLAYVNRDARPGFRIINVLLPGTAVPQASFASVDTFIRFQSGLDEPDVFAALVAALKGAAPPTALQADLPDEPAPYRGMADFGVDDARFFFGRTGYADEMHQRLPHHPFLAVLGASGSGKTSLIQAGFLARLKQGAVPGSAGWPWLVVRPGPHPLRALTIALARLQPQRDPLTVSDAFFGRLQTNPAELSALVQTLLPSEKRLVLIVDRVEELFTLCHSEEERRLFLDAVLGLVQHPHVPSWVVATMRADFYGHVARYTDLANHVVNHQMYLQPMNEDDVAEVIEAPAAQVGAIFEKGLAMQVRADAKVRGEVALPLLQHTLDLLWRKRRGRWLTWDAYQEIGGVAGALRYHADHVIDGLSPDQQDVARRLFTRMIWLEERAGAMIAGQRMEKAVLVDQFSDPQTAEGVLQGLADARLVVLRGEGERATAELVHDTLPLHWERLRAWVQEDQEFLFWRQRLRTDVAGWLHAARDEGALLRGATLAEAEGWFQKRVSELSLDERDLLQNSMALREKEAAEREWQHQHELETARELAEAAEAQRQAEAQRAQEAEARAREQTAAAARQRRLTRWAAGFALVAVTWALLALFQLGRAEHQRKVARVGRLVAQAEMVRNQAPHLLPHSVLLAVEAMHPDGGGGIGSAWLPRALLADTALLGRWLFGEVQLLEAGQALRGGLTLLPQPVFPLPNQVGEQGWAIAVAFSADGKLVLSVSDKDVLVWEVRTGREVSRLVHEQPVRAMALSTDGVHVATTSRDNVARIWEIRSGREVMQLIHEQPLRAIAFSADGKYVATASEMHALVWEARTGVEVSRLEHKDRVAAIAFSPPGTQLATASGREVVVWEALSGAQVTRMEHKGRILAVTFSATGAYLATMSGVDAFVWETASGKAVMQVRHENQITALSFSPDATVLATASTDQTARLWEMPSGREVARFKHGNEEVASAITAGVTTAPSGDVRGLAFSPDSQYLATASIDLTARVWEVRTGREFTRMVHESIVNAVAFNPDGTLVAAATAQGTKVWRVSRGDEVAHLNHEYSVTKVLFSRDGKYLATATSGDTAVRVWDVRGGEEIPGRDQQTLFTTFSQSDGCTAAPTTSAAVPTVSDAVVRRVWQAIHGDGATGEIEPTFVERIALSPDGQYLAAISDSDGSARVWEMRRTQEVARITYEQGVNATAFSPGDGQYLATAGTDRVARVLLWRPSDLIASACARLTRNLKPEEWGLYFADEPYRKICPNLP